MIYIRAGEGIRTLDIDVGNVTLYQLSYARSAENRMKYGQSTR